ncbi:MULTISPECIES: hypothetical protein [Paenibacillus]|uniref:Uncharacterized protein n=1 Tax=Paenibacillus pabuli TaxID=1472 RepID=A0A855Y4B1_9BACL|nr:MULTISPECIES: hypothetical protein [Paenibacillus]PWW45182.1 hypothetical protein DET56_101382 [Paenibacillus pabuli]PXW11519.1 hypothetical protein DEU73_101382 [Paenibacillus taichungensis]
MAEIIVGLSKSNAEMRTTIRYLDQIQRSTERLGRVRYQSLIKVNNELRTTGRRLESVYSTAVRISRLRITPTIGLIDKLSPALDRALVKLNSFRNQMVKASGTVSVEVKQKVEVAMGKMNPAIGPSLALNIGSNNNTVKNVAKEEDSKGFWETVSGVAEIINNINDAIDNIIGKISKFIGLFKKKKGDTSPDATSSPVSRCGCCAGNRVGSFRKVGSKGGNRSGTRTRNAGGERSESTSRRVSNGRRGGRYRTPTPTPSPIITDTSDRALNEARNDRNRRIGNGSRSRFSSGIMSSSPMAMSNLFSGDGMFGKLSGGLAKGAGKLLGPISMLADVANVATAPPEERGRAVGSMIGGTAGTAIGSAIGSVLLPGIGTWVGGAVGGWAGSAAGGWIGDKSKDIGKFMSNATEGVGNALSGAADYISEKTKNITDGISSFFGFGSKKEDKTVSAATVASTSQIATGPQMPPAYIPPALTMTGPEAYMNNKVGQSTSAGFMGTSVMQSQAMGLGNGAQTAGNANGKSSTMTVQISEDQMSSLSSYLKDFKTETTNQISVNVPQGAVQVTVRENAIDYDAISHQVGMRFAGEVRRAMENRKTIMA